MRVKINLEKTNTKFFTYTPKCAKTITFLLKGLPADTDPEEIMYELLYCESEKLNFIKVNNFETAKSKKEGYKLPIFLVQISSESHIKSLKDIDVILYRIPGFFTAPLIASWRQNVLNSVNHMKLVNTIFPMSTPMNEKSYFVSSATNTATQPRTVDARNTRNDKEELKQKD